MSTGGSESEADRKRRAFGRVAMWGRTAEAGEGESGKDEVR
jgi:hypothetical protein